MGTLTTPEVIDMNAVVWYGVFLPQIHTRMYAHEGKTITYHN